MIAHVMETGQSTVDGSTDEKTALAAPVIEYLARIGVQNPSLRETVAADCIARARRLSRRSEDEQLSVRAIEELNQRIETALGKLLGLNPVRDSAKVAGARAALLMCCGSPAADFLFDGSDASSAQSQVAQLLAALPNPTPPEMHLDMPAQPFRFLFFKSS